MTDAIVITGVQPFDGSYDLDLETAPFTTLEWRWIKQTAGYMPATVANGFEGGDPDLIVALAVIAMHRAGKIRKDDVLRTAEQLADVPVDGASIVFRAGDLEDDARPPEVSESTSYSPTGSGEGSSPPTVQLGNGQSHTGDPTSLMHVTSGPLISGT